MKVMKGPLKRLEVNHVMSVKDSGALSKMFLLERRECFRKKPPPNFDVKKKKH